MKKREYPFLSYNYLDSQRLRNSFFSTEKKKPFPKKIIIYSATGLLVLSLVVVLLNYELIILKRDSARLKAPAVSLLRGKLLSSLILLDQNQQEVDTKSSYIQLSIPARDTVGVRANFNKPIDLNHNDLILYVKKPPVPLKAGIVVKDNQFHSNSLSPLMVDLPTDNSVSYTEILVKLQNAFLQNTNLGKIKQLSIYLYPQDKEKAAWLLIKDLALIKKETEILP